MEHHHRQKKASPPISSIANIAKNVEVVVRKTLVSEKNMLKNNAENDYQAPPNNQTFVTENRTVTEVGGYPLTSSFRSKR